MKDSNVYAITGACGYLGRYIARRLLEADENAVIRVLTGHPEKPNPFGDRARIVPFHFDNPDKLVADLGGVKTVFNTYWVRFSYGDISFGQAVANVQNLIRAAAAAGVERFVHISITNPGLDSPFGYFHGKAVMEKTLIESGLSYAILRPTVLFGKEDILINNIAWLLRRFPLFAVCGDGEYRIQPVYVDDVAKLAVESAFSRVNLVRDAVGPETYSFAGLVRLLRERVGSRAKLVYVRPITGLALSKLLNLLARDVVITRQEIGGLMADLLWSPKPPECATSFSRWSRENADSLGTRYASELDRHYRRGGLKNSAGARAAERVSRPGSARPTAIIDNDKPAAAGETGKR